MFKTPFILPLLYPKLTWKINTEKKVIYLTFDDGPIPEVTEFVLNELKEFNANATFFCIGENIERHPKIFHKLLNEGHSVGNHTFNHLNGWKTSDETYIENVSKCDDIFKKNGVNTKLLRPPYGRIKKSQIRLLAPDYELIMWDILTKDYNQTVDKEVALNRCVKHTSSGSIVVLHDSLKASNTMQYVLPRYLHHFNKLGFEFDALPMVW